jgi:CheY-like chemotaxis protein
MSQKSAETRLLLVDDDATQLQLLDISLERIDESFTFEQTSSCEKALEIISRWPFDCIVSNYTIEQD